MWRKGVKNVKLIQKLDVILHSETITKKPLLGSWKAGKSAKLVQIPVGIHLKIS